jgi:hypothetical protein
MLSNGSLLPYVLSSVQEQIGSSFAFQVALLLTLECSRSST